MEIISDGSSLQGIHAPENMAKVGHVTSNKSWRCSKPHIIAEKTQLQLAGFTTNRQKIVLFNLFIQTVDNGS